MSLAKSVKSYQDLEVWQRSMKLTEVIYQITSKFPSSEQWGLTIQMREPPYLFHLTLLRVLVDNLQVIITVIYRLPEVPYWSWKLNLSCLNV